MKRLIFILIFISFSSNVFPQWLVDGGNLIWPYGDVSVSNGNIITDSNFVSNGRYLSKPRYMIGYLSIDKGNDELDIVFYRNDFGSLDSAQFASGYLYLYMNSPSFNGNSSYGSFTSVSYSSADSGNTYIPTTSFLTTSNPSKIIFYFTNSNTGSFYTPSYAGLSFMFFEYPLDSTYLNYSNYYRNNLQ